MSHADMPKDHKMYPMVHFDLKILPDRAHYALSHRGVAYEISAITGLSMKEKQITKIDSLEFSVLVKNTDFSLCPRYMARVVENISIKESSKEIKEKLMVIGARPINNLVDIMNYVMFDLGQPMHIFDADKVVGGIVVRKAKDGEKITTLDGKEVVLNNTTLVIADEEAPLAIAGIKGGKKAEVDGKTKRIIIESANFSGVSVRRTSTKIGIRNDSSKRFENTITPHLASTAIDLASAMITEILPEAKFGKIIDVCEKLPEKTVLGVSPEMILQKLGVKISDTLIVEILEKLKIEVVKKAENFVLTIPYERLDISIWEDVAEEVGRIYGFDKIPSIIPEISSFKAVVNKEYFYNEKIKNILIGLGFSEVITHILGGVGDLETLYPASKDRKYLRNDLTETLKDLLETNGHNADLLGLKSVKIFEIGKTFKDGVEKLFLVLGIKNTTKQK